MQPECSQNAVKMQPKFSQNAAKMQPKCSQNSVKMQSFFGVLKIEVLFILFAYSKGLVRFNVPRDSDGRSEENSAIGICVPENSNLCPGPDQLSLQEGINCRPGRLGIISEALHCPKTDSKIQQNLPETGQRPPSLIQILLSQIPDPFAFT